jgi:hypothetical protein
MARRKRAEDEREWSGVFGAKGAGAWVKHELWMESLPDEALAPAGSQPVSVRVEPETLALLDAFAARFKQSRSGVLLELIRSGLGEAFRALPKDEQLKIAATVQAKAPNAGGLRRPARVLEVDPETVE